MNQIIDGWLDIVKLLFNWVSEQSSRRSVRARILTMPLPGIEVTLTVLHGNRLPLQERNWRFLITLEDIVLNDWGRTSYDVRLAIHEHAKQIVSNDA